MGNLFTGEVALDLTRLKSSRSLTYNLLQPELIATAGTHCLEYRLSLRELKEKLPELKL